MTRTRTLLALFLLASLTACSDDEEVILPLGGCSFAATGAGPVAVSPGQGLTHASGDATAQNTLDHQTNGALLNATGTSLRHGPCGKAGLLLRSGKGSSTALSYVDPEAGGAPESVDAKPSGTVDSAQLLFDASCQPLVLLASTAGLREYRRSSTGTWSAADVVTDLASVLGGTASAFTLVGSQQGSAKLHLFAHAMVGGSQALVLAERPATAGSTWSLTKHPRPQVSQLSGYAVHPTSGALHAIYRNTSYPCDPCNMDFYFGTLAKGTSSWTQEILQKGVWGDPDDTFVESASMVFDATGSIWVAAHFVRRVVTGSYKDTQLRFYGKAPNGWCGETVVTQNDTYAGSDGKGFTGAEPQAVLDNTGRLHVLFVDQAIWHASGMQNEIRGQLRHAVRAGTQWTLTTLFTQKGQTASPKPLDGVANPMMSASPDGTRLVAAGVVFSWQTDSIYNTSSAKASYKTQSFPASVK